jgi:hypothetical protein
MSEQGYAFYLYAPKGDLFLRKRWREFWPETEFLRLRSMVERFHSHGIRVGVGLSPHEFHLDPEKEATLALKKKLGEIVSLGVDHIAILFDDMKGDLPGLVEKQIRLVHGVLESTGLQVSMCPTYYSLDPVLDRLFGERPKDYLEQLGKGLDSSVEIFWTGEKICSKNYPLEHLAEVAETLRRKPLLWDNYPVNDTESMSRYLHLRAFEGRPQQLNQVLSGHLINPMLQMTLSKIPAFTLAESYRLGDSYNAQRAFEAACHRMTGEGLAQLIERDLAWFQDQGLQGIDDVNKQELKREYRKYAEHPAAREVLGWLDGNYCVTRDQILAQQ